MASRRYYSEYVGHFVRFYLKYPGQTRFKTEQEKKMYNAVHDVWNELELTENSILRQLYLATPLNAEVEKVSEEQGLTSASIWKLVLRFEDEVARAGGLL